MPTSTTIDFIDEENHARHLTKLLTWLEDDYRHQREPKASFWHNREIITASFEEHEALVALNEEKAVVGFMVWHIRGSDCSAEINMVEVKADCRKQGLLKKMLTAFTGKFDSLYMLSASVLEQSQTIFKRVGWIAYGDPRSKRFYRILKEGTPELDTLPDGLAIGVCSECFYKVKIAPDKYRLKYFQVNVDGNALLKPIMTPHHYEGYVAVYFNKVLKAAGKAKHLFSGGYDRNFLVLTRLPEKYLPDISQPVPEAAGAGSGGDDLTGVYATASVVTAIVTAEISIDQPEVVGAKRKRKSDTSPAPSQ